ncbi:MAG: type VI secretion system protein TssA [Aquabacterium sp.]|nr:type VI secretion system protein TssA [Aquabacterium sp.]
MAVIDVDALLAPLAQGDPCGPDLEYDSAFLALEEAARGKAEQQFGDTIIAAEEPDWRKVQSLSQALAMRTRDLRVAVHLLRASTRLQGLAAAAEGLRLIEGLLSQHWDHVHPLLDADDHNDPTMRLNALAPLVDGAAFLADVRKAPLLAGRGGITGRECELASGKVVPHGGEAVIPMAGIAQAMRDAEAQQAGLAVSLLSLVDTVNAIDKIITDRASTSGPEFRPLRMLLQTIVDAASQVADGGASHAVADDAPHGTASAVVGVSAPAGAIRSREDAIAAIDKVCQWLELNEPSNPAPLLIRRGQRLMSKNFLDIIRDLVPDGIDQIAKLAGVPADQ